MKVVFGNSVLKFGILDMVNNKFLAPLTGIEMKVEFKD